MVLFFCQKALLLQLCSQQFRNNFCLQMSPFLSSLSSPLTWPLPPLLSGLCFSHFHSPTFSALLCACPSLPLCHPLPLLFSSFCACVFAMWLNVLSGLCSMCATWRRRLCGAPAGLDWASSPRWSWHGAAHFPSSPGKQILFCFFLPTSLHYSYFHTGVVNLPLPVL